MPQWQITLKTEDGDTRIIAMDTPLKKEDALAEFNRQQGLVNSRTGEPYFPPGEATIAPRPKGKPVPAIPVEGMGTLADIIR